MLYHLSLRVAEAALFLQNDRGDKSREFRHYRDYNYYYIFCAVDFTNLAGRLLGLSSANSAN